MKAKKKKKSRGTYTRAEIKAMFGFDPEAKAAPAGSVWQRLKANARQQ